MAQSLTFFEFSLKDIKEEVEEILYKLDSISMTSKTSILIISPQKFKNVLTNIQDKIELIYPPTDQYIPQYYDISKTYVFKKDNKLYFIIEIPIKSPYEYDLYKLHYLWLPIQNYVGWSRKIDNKENFFAISHDRTKYILLEYIDYCIYLNPSIICTPHQEIQKTNINKMNCIISLFNENITNNNCVFLYERNRNI